jgi:hypothetical protein
MEMQFQGHSDDIFEAAGDEFYRPYAVLVAGPGGQLVVRATYTEQGVWNIGVEPADEGIPLPDWEYKIGTASNGYSALLTITAPGKCSVNALED